MEKWEVLDSGEDILRVSNKSIVVWEKFDQVRGRWVFSSIVQEGSIDHYFEE